MTWTYGADPANNPVDEVHFLVGDTNTAEQLIQNEEITYYLALYPKPAGKPAYLAAAAVADAIAAQFARRAQRSVGSLAISANQQYEHYVQEAERLREAFRTNGKGGTGFSGIKAAAPVLGGGGDTVLGDTSGGVGDGTP